MRFKIDENLPREFALMLRDAGHDAHDVVEESLGGQPDDRIAERCRAEDRVIVTLDLDFADIRMYPPQGLAGMLVLRAQHQDKRHLIRIFDRVIALLKTEEISHRLWIADETGVRIRE